MSAQREQAALAAEFIVQTGRDGAAIRCCGAGAQAGQTQAGQTPLAAFAARLYARVSPEDLSALSPEGREKAAALAAQALAEWRPGAAVIKLEEDAAELAPQEALPGAKAGKAGGASAARGKVSVLTLVNTNKPFLFDSALAEIYGGGRFEAEGGAGRAAGFAPPSVYLAAHPVFAAARQRDGSLLLAQAQDGAAGGARVSVIQFCLKLADKRRGAKLVAGLKAIIAQARAVFHGRKPMTEALAALEAEYQARLPARFRPQLPQVAAFLDWLARGNFIFLGLREYACLRGENGLELRPRGARLGILADEEIRIVRGADSAAARQGSLSFIDSGDLMLVTKARSRSRVHRNVFLDYIGLKLFGENGETRGELRFVGLFTASVYHASVLSIPYLKPKAEAAMRAAGYDRGDHSSRALLNILETYPRDDLFRLSGAEIAANAAAVLSLSERPRVRVLSNADRFGHFVSCLVFVPRDRFNTENRRAIGKALLRLCSGDFYECAPRFFDENLTRARFVIHCKSAAAPGFCAARAEAEITALISTWEDKITALAEARQTPKAEAALALRLPQSYRDAFTPREALHDAARIARLSAQEPLYVEFSAGQSGLLLKLFSRGGAASLSRRVPLLENMGFKTVSERTFELPAALLRGFGREEAAPVFLHEMELESAAAPAGAGEKRAPGKTAAALFAAVWEGKAADDGFNALAQAAGLSLRAIFVLRAYGRYLQQAGIPHSQNKLAAALCRYPAAAQALCALFAARLSPASPGGAALSAAAEEAKIEEGLSRVPSLEDDRIIRAFRNLIAATVRTNAFSCENADLLGETLAIKFDPHKIDGLPEPRPYREIFVYGPQAEGVHLRFGPVARGGIRWSDRGQDYRTEVLGLVKAQQVKNAVIVPVGAKGGFYPHHLPEAGQERAQAGREAYKTYIRAMLSITDNIENGKVKPAPAAPVRLDGDDPYFVVAADKGTASFSDTANALAQAEGFWLDDAFASGGSEGYDHKKLGITAKGAWEAVKRHFREMGRDIQREEFTAAGVGDMSGDVFGNAMLLSEKIRLVAAFDHRDIFIDPAPDCAVSHAERARLFALPRSSWQDYDSSKISAGGGVFSRARKYIALPPQAAAAIDLGKSGGAPAEIIAAILRAPVDLLFFGGIGTYVRGAHETDAQVGDHANDAVRIEGAELRAKAVGEGANLGMTQSGRVEYAFCGGRSNTDAIDNSAGVNCSDMEVNIKIAFAAAMAAGKLSRAARNVKLREMAAEVSKLVLRNNYVQGLALSLGQRRARAFLPAQIRFMNSLEKRGLLDRKVEALPDNRILAERQEKGQGLARPELAVLTAYAKNTLKAELANSALADDSYCGEMLFAYFPRAMHKDFAEEIKGHRLRREIIATALANDIVNRGGASFVSRLQDKTGQSAEDVARAFIIVRDGLSLDAVYAEIDALDNKIDGAAQNSFYEALAKMLFDTSGWALRNIPAGGSLRARVALVKSVYHAAAKTLPELLPDSGREKLAAAERGYAAQGAPQKLAHTLAVSEFAAVIADIALIADEAGYDAKRAAQVYFALAELFSALSLAEQAGKLPERDYYDGLAVERAQNALAESLRKMAVSALRKFGNAGQPAQAWRQAAGARAEEAAALIQAMRTKDMSVSRLTVAAGILADLAAECG